MSETEITSFDDDLLRSYTQACVVQSFCALLSYQSQIADRLALRALAEMKRRGLEVWPMAEAA